MCGNGGAQVGWGMHIQCLQQCNDPRGEHIHSPGFLSSSTVTPSDPSGRPEGSPTKGSHMKTVPCFSLQTSETPSEDQILCPSGRWTRGWPAWEGERIIVQWQ